MAKKNQKFNKYTEEFRNKIIQELKNKSIAQVSKEFQVNPSTLASWEKNFKNNKLNTKPGPKKGQIRDKEYYKERYEILKKYQDFLTQQKKKK